MSDLFNQVQSIIADMLEIDADKITMESKFQESVEAGGLGADSLDIVDLVMEFEDKFGFEIPDEAAQDIKTVGDVVKFIEQEVA